MRATRPLLITLTVAAAIFVTASVGARAADVEENWSKNCASCHGKDGKGETKAGKKAGVKDMTDAKYQADLSDEKALAVIKDGLKEDGKEKMKPFAAKLSDDEIKALIAKVRTFKK